MQKDIAKRIELLTILILSFSPQLISLHNVLVTECIVGDSSTLIFFAEIESSKTSHSIPFLTISLLLVLQIVSLHSTPFHPTC